MTNVTLTIADGGQVTFHNGTLSFTANGITLSSAKPDITLLVGDLEEEIRLTPHTQQETTVKQKDRNTPFGESKDYTWEWHYDHVGCSFSWTLSILKHLPAFTIRSTFTNTSDKAVRLREIGLIRTLNDTFQCEGDPSSWLLAPLTSNTRIGTLAEILSSVNEETIKIWAGFNLPVPTAFSQDEKQTDGHWRSYEDFVTLYTDQGSRGLAMGVVGSPEADVRFHTKITEGKMRLEVVSEMTDIIVESKGSRDSQEVMFYIGDYDSSVPTLLNWLANSHGSRTDKGPIYGWCSWYDRGPNISEQTISDTLTELKNLENRIPMQFIQIDDGYQRQAGDWRCNDKFPDGFKEIQEKIRTAGAEPVSIVKKWVKKPTYSHAQALLAVFSVMWMLAGSVRIRPLLGVLYIHVQF
jgi:alpha-galactosidase